MTEAQTLRDILDYWHKIEFFIPFDLKQVWDNTARENLTCLKASDLNAGAKSPWRVEVGAERELAGFRLYVGIFDMQVIADFARELPGAEPVDSIDEAERTALDGETCIAKVTLDVHGQPDFASLSVSSVPWALGTARRDGLAALTSAAFDAARQDLSGRLSNYEAERRRLRLRDADSATPKHGPVPVPVPLSGDEIIALRTLLAEWAGWALPVQSSVALLEIVTRKKNNGKPKAAAAAAGQGKTPTRAASSSSGAAEPDEDDDEESDAADEQTVDILNSFYIEDIERCMASLDRGDLPATIRAYLLPADVNKRLDLYIDAGREAIVRAQHPTKTNVGHWPEDSSRTMSLMQQFAINTAFEHLESGAIFSVNGPPGTGKTTLLRDMICENIVRRASELAKLANAADGFEQTRSKIPFADGNSATIRKLRPALTGFEMVVASSNNAAVENISNDLPKRKQLGAAWRDVRYLQPVAHKVAAQNGEKDYLKLASSDVPWGMISCALGNAKNRRRFCNRFFDDWRPEDERGGKDDPHAIRDWLKHYAGPGFAAAKTAFLDARASFQLALDERLRYADLHTAWADVPEAQFTQAATDRLTEAGRALNQASAEHTKCVTALQKARAALATLQDQERLIDRQRPGIFARLRRTKDATEHEQKVKKNAGDQIVAHDRITTSGELIDPALDAVRAAQAEKDLADAALADATAVWRKNDALLEQGRAKFAGMRLPESPERVETDKVQCDGFWQDAELAQLRTRVFVAALALHEAWLAEVAQTGGEGFGGNLFAISKLLRGGRLENPADASLVWQSFFMVVPVVSSTFASFARQFRGMGPGSIGWLFIDEAGQAVPQAAVGALWRARRAMVVGDPLQIEPVFTVPTQLITALANLSVPTSDGRYSPAKVSVQRLADDANPFGTYVAVEGEGPLWIGSPLRVHRRCVDPMFSIANRIAYHDKMVFGLKSRVPDSDPLHLGDSAWVDVRGKTADKQVVPQQIEIVEKMIVRLYAESGKLPPLYVISPFKAIKKALLSRLEQLDLAVASRRAGPSKKDWASWCSKRIGTVHTFQGKEESVVIFVLGADHDNAGSANWAVSKPNLLNVALTRAQQRIFVVGDASLWGELKYFSVAREKLGTPITAQQWLARVGTTAELREAELGVPDVNVTVGK
ncbi:ATP-binding protein [Paraburkholderia sp. D15]|uniref:DEAD/DEAH box helicase n=1 Tax=Paraburkholderia sp. D15 TaxID=2880218 RepID=UPI00247AB074|nr:DEAD/DEAH box helicase [Paraburkholderia sp. D15]WGS53713.1 ATP-binding protein [Paraburkholderia sp. D15]